MPLKVVTVGGGIAGLSAAIAFARNGHEVHIYERWDPSRHGESGSGILLMPNVMHILEQWDMLSELSSVAHAVPATEFRMPDGEVIMRRDWSNRGEAWYGLRGALNALFRRIAAATGVAIHDNMNVGHVDHEKNAVALENGSTVAADLIIGADGSNSRVRRDVFPEYKPATLDMACFQVSMPLADVENDSTLRQLMNGPDTVITLSPGRNIYASPAPAQNSFDVQFVDQEYSLAQDSRPGLVNERITHLEWLRTRWSDHSRPYQAILEKVESAFKMEVYRGPRFAILVERPFAGQGCASGIEDAALLAHLLRNTSSGDDIEKSLAVYEKVRRSRVEKIQDYAAAMGRMWACKDPEEIAQRGQAWRKSKEEQIKAVSPDMHAAFNSVEFQAWLNQHKVVQDSALAKM